MRIISGKYKGISLSGFAIEGTRPTMDRVKESLFGMIGPYIKESKCLDLFAGAGTLGLEAISNGASSCDFVDTNSKCIKAIEETIKRAKMKEACSLHLCSYESFLKECDKKQLKFDLIFLDPPYAVHCISSILDKINAYNLLEDDGLLICEYETEKIETNDFSLYKERKYGSKKIQIYKKRA